MANLILNGSTSGSVTLSSPAVSGTTTLTLPTTSGTVLTSGTNTNFPTGSVVQVVQGTYSTQTTTTSSTFSDTGLTASITPSSSSNKILILVSHAGCLKFSTNTTIGMKIVRNSTDIHNFGGRTGLTDGTVANEVGTMATIYLDSPATTSSTTYKTQYNSNANTGTTLLQDSTSGTVVSTITLMEIKG
jgi:hypothetical protein